MQKTIFSGHPKGLAVLFFTELWERFSYYGMKAILVLFLTAETTGRNPGWGWENAEALELFGWYTMMVYVMGIPGGLLADKLLGQKKTVMLGGILLCVGHLILAIQSQAAFYTGLVLIVSGIGALKPNISTMVGGLYEKGDARRDTGFYLFYIGINIGALVAPLLVGYIGEKINWHYGFGLAGVGMVFGQIVYVWGQKHLKGIGDFHGAKTVIGKKIQAPLTKIEKDRMIILFLSFLIVLVFWGAYEQAGGLISLFTKEKIDRNLWGVEIAASQFQSLPALFVILMGIPVAWFWANWRKMGRESFSVFKMGVGTIVMGLGFVALMGAAYELTLSALDKASLYWLLLAYFLHVLGELSLSPVALSFITKLAPAKYASFMMGAYFAVTGFGNKLAGMLGEYAQSAGEMAVFTGVAVFCIVFGLLLLLFVKKLKALSHGAEE